MTYCIAVPETTRIKTRNNHRISNTSSTLQAILGEPGGMGTACEGRTSRTLRRRRGHNLPATDRKVRGRNMAAPKALCIMAHGLHAGKGQLLQASAKKTAENGIKIYTDPSRLEILLCIDTDQRPGKQQREPNRQRLRTMPKSSPMCKT